MAESTPSKAADIKSAATTATPAVVTSGSSVAPAKKSNTLIIVIIIIAVLLFLCCGIPTIFFGGIGNFLNSEMFKKQVEKAIEDEAKKQGADVDVSVNSDTNKTKPLPSGIPEKVQKIIPSSWGDPYSTVRTNKETTGEFAALYSLKNKTLATAQTELEASLKAGNWTYTDVEGSSGVVVYYIQSPTESDTDLTLSLTQKGSDLEVGFGGTYAK